MALLIPDENVLCCSIKNFSLCCRKCSRLSSGTSCAICYWSSHLSIKHML